MSKKPAMSDQPGEFWNVDLTRLTWSGWLLMLVTIGVVAGVVVIEAALASAFGLRGDPANPLPRWVGILALLPAIAVGAGFFELGRRLFRSKGCPITRPGRSRKDERN